MKIKNLDLKWKKLKKEIKREIKVATEIFNHSKNRNLFTTAGIYSTQLITLKQILDVMKDFEKDV